MSCQHEPRNHIQVPADLQPYAPNEASTIAHCPVCLAVEATSQGEETVSPQQSTEAVPPGDAGVATILLVDQLSSLALNRDSIDELIKYIEGEGADAFSTLERLIGDPAIEPAVDIERRLTQLEGMV